MHGQEGCILEDAMNPLTSMMQPELQKRIKCLEVSATKKPRHRQGADESVPKYQPGDGVRKDSTPGRDRTRYLRNGQVPLVSALAAVHVWRDDGGVNTYESH